MSVGDAKKVVLNLKGSSLIEIEDGYSGCWVKSNYADVEQRWLVVKSEHASEQEQITLERRLDKQITKEIKGFERLCKKEFACEKDASNALEEFEKNCEILAFTEIKISQTAVFKVSVQQTSPRQGI